jgi:hypothetical protein
MMRANLHAETPEGTSRRPRWRDRFTFGLQPASPKRLLLAVALLAGSLTFLGAPSANAAGETLTVILTQIDGTAPFDADSTPGRDANDANGIVRTNDVLLYNVELRVADAPSTNTTFTATFPKGVEMSQVPPFCTGSGSSLSPATLGDPIVPVTATSWEALPQQTLVCNVGGPNGQLTFTYPVPVKVRPEVPNGTLLRLETVRATSSDVTTPEESAPVEATVSARAQFDLSKNGLALNENSGRVLPVGNLACPTAQNPDRMCVTVGFPMTISAPAGGKGLTPMSPTITFTDDLTPESFYGPAITTHPAWIAAGPGALERYGAVLRQCRTPQIDTPWSRIGQNSSATAENSVRHSGTTSCTQPGGPARP